MGFESMQFKSLALRFLEAIIHWDASDQCSRCRSSQEYLPADNQTESLRLLDPKTGNAHYPQHCQCCVTSTRQLCAQLPVERCTGFRPCSWYECVDATSHAARKRELMVHTLSKKVQKGDGWGHWPNAAFLPVIEAPKKPGILISWFMIIPT